jgi:hypothetical protein
MIRLNFEEKELDITIFTAQSALGDKDENAGKKTKLALGRQFEDVFSISGRIEPLAVMV